MKRFEGSQNADSRLEALMRSFRQMLGVSPLVSLVLACASGEPPARPLSDPANPSAREGIRFALPVAATDDAGSDGHVHDHGSGPSAGTIYSCPMHPEVVQDHPGTCPKCGMTLKAKP